MSYTLEVLFDKETRDEVEAAVAARADGYQLPADFHTQGQVFADVHDYEIGGGFLEVETASREDPEQTVVYYYPVSTIARIKATQNK